MPGGRPRKSVAELVARRTYRSDRHAARSAEPAPVVEPEMLAEAKRWATTFETGTDYFHDLPELAGKAPRDGKNRRARRLTRATWSRLGAAYLTTRTPDPARPTCWAEAEFGRP